MLEMVTLDMELGNYIIEDEISRDDLTIVYQGQRASDGMAFGIKVVAPQFTFDEIFVRRFKDIARQTIKLEHPNIVRTFEVDQKDGTPFVVRELIEGRPLSEVIETEGPFSPHRMLVIAQQIAAALDYAHQKSIMHGNLSASRIYLGEDDRVIVTDFGQTQATAGTSLVNQGYAVGSPETLAPERVRGQGPSRQSDLYSLGVLCYQMLNKLPPFVGEPAAVLHAQAYEQPQPLHMVNPGVSVPLSEAIGRMLSKGLELRYTTGAEFTRALTVAIQGTAPVRRISVGTGGEIDVRIGPATPLWRRPWVWLLLIVPIMVLLLLAGFLAVSAWLAMLAGFTIDTPLEEAAAIQPPAVIQPAGDEEAPPPSAPEPEQPQQPNAAVVLVEPTQATTSVTAATSPTATAIPPTPTATPTQIPLPTPGPPTVAENSPFTDLVLAHAISEEGEAEKVGAYFAPGADPVYLFFDYGNIEPGTAWAHRWTWGDVELDVYEDVWPNNYFETGTAWVYYRPIGGFQPGPYKVTLEIDGTVVATATFVIQAGGL